MAQYATITADGTKANVSFITDISTLGDAKLAIGIGDDNVTNPLFMKKSLTNMVNTAIHRLSKHAKENIYPATGLNIHHWSCSLRATKDTVSSNGTLVNVDGHASLAIGPNFFATARGNGAAGTKAYYPPLIVESAIEKCLSYLNDNYLAQQ